MKSRLLSPSGFALALILLLFPFVGVACSEADVGAIDAGYTGFDLVTGGEPGYEASGPVADQTMAGQFESPDPGVQVLAILLVVLLLAGLAAALVPLAQTRAKASVAVAGVAIVLTVVIQFVAQSNLVSSIQELLLLNIFNTPQEIQAPQFSSEEYLSDATGTRIGFWLVLAVLLATAAVNALALRAEPATVGGTPGQT